MVAIERVVTSGEFRLDGGRWAVDNNVWLVGDEQEVVVIDPAHDSTTIKRAVGSREIVAAICTHGHNDHIGAAAALGAPVWLHPDDTQLWAGQYPGREPDGLLAEGDEIKVAGQILEVVCTPGHTWGSVSLYEPELGAVFTGDTLFAGGPGTTGSSYSDFGMIVHSIRRRLLTLPPATTVYTGHGETTTIAAESPHVEEWIARGF